MIERGNYRSIYSGVAELQKRAGARMVLRFARGIPRPVHILFGVAAFPSLHVAFQTLVFLWMRRVWRAGQIIFGVFVVAILIGSLVTGWHYLIDGIAGIALAALCYWIFAIRLAPKTF